MDKKIIMSGMAAGLVLMAGCKPQPLVKVQDAPKAEAAAGAEKPKDPASKVEETARNIAAPATQTAPSRTSPAPVAGAEKKLGADAKTSEADKKMGSDAKVSSPGKSLSAAESLINYGTGSTQMKAKQSMTDKVKKINEQHNKKVEEEVKKN